MPLPDVAAIRLRMNFTQADFASCFGFPVATLRHWEQGTREPAGAALVLLNVIARHPRIVLTTVARYRNLQRGQLSAEARRASLAVSDAPHAKRSRAARRG
jgi:transcriptional regulator with XRE-family HTH domain